MEYVIAFVVLYVAVAVIWVVSLVVYSRLVGGLDLGTLGGFVLKSAGLVAVATAVLLFIPYGGFLAIVVWWFGLMLLFGMEFWDAKALVGIIWVLTFLLRLAILALMFRAAQG